MNEATTVDPPVIMFGITLILIAVAAVICGMSWLASFIAGAFRSFSVSSVSVNQAPPNGADEADRQTDKRVSAASMAPPPQQLDRSRSGMIYTLLRDGWTTSEMRPWLRGDNNTISAEINEAKKRLGLCEPERTIRVRDHAGEREIAL